MNTTHGSAALQSGAEAIAETADQVKHGARQMTDSAVHGVKRAGREVSSFAQRRPVETALLGASAACLIAGLAFWFSRPD